MKIISNKKDFYDYINGYDTDNSLVYLRNTSFLSYNNKSDKLIMNNIHNMLKDFIPENQTLTTTSKDYNISIEYVLVGIYPIVYLLPFIIVNGSYNPIFYYRNNSVKYFYVDDKTYTDKSHLIDYIAKKINVKSHNKIGMPSFLYNKDVREKNIVNTDDGSYEKMSVLVNPKKFEIENQDVFKLLGAPTFIMFDKTINKNYCVIEYMLDEKEQHFERTQVVDDVIVNPIFNTYNINFISYIEDKIYKRDIYSDIENFLYSIKETPISEPDNKTKIVNAGFDLKTSFRNIK